MTNHNQAKGTECCGDITIAYYRSRSGGVVHRAGCTRKGNAAEWHYAARIHANDHNAVLADIASFPWLRACHYCMAVPA